MKVSIIVIVWIDNDYNLISLKEKHKFDKSAFTEFGNPNFVQLAESFEAVGFHIKSTQEFAQTLEKVKSIQDKPVIIAVDVDCSRNVVLLDDTFRCMLILLMIKNSIYTLDVIIYSIILCRIFSISVVIWRILYQK